MLAAFVSSPDFENPLDALEIGERPEPECPEGWATVDVRAASLNHHDIWSLRGVGLPEERMPMILGCDAAGIDAEGNEVVVHGIIGDPTWHGDESFDPKRTLLSEQHQGAFAERLIVPERNLIPLPEGMSLEQASCMPTAWLTAYRMLFVTGAFKPGETVLVQGAGGGVASAAIALGSAAGIRVWATSRSEQKCARALDLGADASFETGARLPERVDGVLETVGEATWAHSLRALKPGGKLVVAGATSGFNPPGELQRVFFLQLSILGSTMGSKEELERLLRFCSTRGVEPEIDRVLPLSEAREGFGAMEAGELVGKVVFTVGG